MVTASLARQDPEHVVGIHLNMPVVGRDAMSMEGLTAAEEATLAHMAEFQKWETGYSGQQSTRPQTLGYGLADSPAGQCAWIVEKLHAVDRLRRTPRKRPHPRRDAGQRDAVLAARYRLHRRPGSIGRVPQRGIWVSSRLPPDAPSSPRRSSGCRAVGRRSGSPIFVTGTSSTGAGTSRRSSNPNCSSTSSGRSLPWCGERRRRNLTRLTSCRVSDDARSLHAHCAARRIGGSALSENPVSSVDALDRPGLGACGRPRPRAHRHARPCRCAQRLQRGALRCRHRDASQLRR